MLKRILLAYDASEPAERAFRFALELAKHFNATLGILAFASVWWPPTAAEMAGFLESTAERLERSLVALRQTAEACGLSLSTRVVTARPAARIIREATEQGADLIVMRPGHRSRVGRLFLRSISQRVSVHAPCNVIIVR